MFAKIRKWWTGAPATRLVALTSTPANVGHDAPVTLRDDDDLDRWVVARALHRTIATAPAQWSTRIGLYGSWGSGKTSVLNFLEQMCDKRDYLVVRFSAWEAEGESGVIGLFYRALDKRLDEEKILRPVGKRAKAILGACH